MKYANFKRMTAMVMATAMVCSPLAVKAAVTTDESTANDKDIKVESDLKYLNKNVYGVFLPTVSGEDLKFTLDPQGLLNVADPTNFPDGAGAVYFKPESGDMYKDTSKVIKIGNASGYDLDATVSVDVTLPEGVTLAEELTDLDDATEPMVYLALKGVVKGASGLTAATNGEAMALAKGKNTYTTLTASKLPEILKTADSTAAGYYVDVTGTGTSATYKYELSQYTTESTVPDESVVEYVLTGKCSTDTEAWKKVLDQQDDVSNAVKAEATITWELTKSARPEKTTVTANGAEVESIAKAGGTVVEVTFPAGETLDKISYSTDGTTFTNELTEDIHYTMTDIKYGKKIEFKDLSALGDVKAIKILSSDAMSGTNVELKVTEKAEEPVVDEAPTFTASTTKNTISFTEGSGTKKLASIESIKAKNTKNGKWWDVYNVETTQNLWGAATEDKSAGTITLDSKADGKKYSFATTVTITYYTADDSANAKTAEVEMVWQ